MGTAITDFRPMLAKAEVRDALVKGHFPAAVDGSDGWIMEPKHDGMRAVIEVDSDLPGGIRIASRSGLGYNDHLFDNHKELLKTIIPNGSIIDGELALIKRFEDIVDTENFPVPILRSVPIVDFNATMRIMGPNADKARVKQSDLGLITYLMFDVVKWDGVDVSGDSFAGRRRLLETLIRWVDTDSYGDNPPFFVNPYFQPSVKTYDAFLAARVEGTIMKRLGAPYQPGKRPSKTWVKIKAENTFDVVVTGFTDGRGKYEGQIGAIQFGAYDKDGKLQRVGQCSGMDDAERKIWSDARDVWDEDLHTGVYVIEVKANGMVGSGEYRTPRHPQYVVLRNDKLPHECTMEQFKEDDR